MRDGRRFASGSSLGLFLHPRWVQEDEAAWIAGRDETVGPYRGILRSEAASNLMRIPPDAVIDEAKLTRYLLVPRPWDDKSGYLRQAGFDRENWPISLTLSGVWPTRSTWSRIARTATEPSIVLKA